MKNIIIFIGIIVIGTSVTFGQNTNNDSQISINNYKHTNKAIEATSTDTRQNLTEQAVQLRSQRTNKVSEKDCVLLPTNTVTTTNVQGTKNKANYKNQF